MFLATHSIGSRPQLTLSVIDVDGAAINTLFPPFLFYSPRLWRVQTGQKFTKQYPFVFPVRLCRRLGLVTRCDSFDITAIANNNIKTKENNTQYDSFLSLLCKCFHYIKVSLQNSSKSFLPSRDEESHDEPTLTQPHANAGSRVGRTGFLLHVHQHRIERNGEAHRAAYGKAAPVGSVLVGC